MTIWSRRRRGRDGKSADRSGALSCGCALDQTRFRIGGKRRGIEYIEKLFSGGKLETTIVSVCQAHPGITKCLGQFLKLSFHFFTIQRIFYFQVEPSTFPILQPSRLKDTGEAVYSAGEAFQTKVG